MNQPNCECSHARMLHLGALLKCAVGHFANDENPKCTCKSYRPASDSTEGQGDKYVPLEKRHPRLYEELADPEYARGYVETLLGAVDAYASHNRSLKAQVVAANKGAETNARVNQLMAADLLKARTALEELVEVVKEICDLMDGVRDGSYTPDSFTNQPLAAALSKAQEVIGKE